MECYQSNKNDLPKILISNFFRYLTFCCWKFKIFGRSIFCLMNNPWISYMNKNHSAVTILTGLPGFFAHQELFVHRPGVQCSEPKSGASMWWKQQVGIGRDGGDDLEQSYPQILSFHTRRVWHKYSIFFSHETSKDPLSSSRCSVTTNILLSLGIRMTNEIITTYDHPLMVLKWVSWKWKLMRLHSCHLSAQRFPLA